MGIDYTDAGGVRRPFVARLVLVVDDDPLVLDVAARMLEDLGCDVVTAADAEEALETLADQRVEILITDVNMPGMGWIRTGQRGRENA